MEPPLEGPIIVTLYRISPGRYFRKDDRGIIPSRATGTWPGRFGYQGQAWIEILSADGTQRFRLSPTRIYDPVTGRFLQNEPVVAIRRRGKVRSMANRVACHYTYVLDNPIAFLDPIGLDTSPTECGQEFEKSGKGYDMMPNVDMNKLNVLQLTRKTTGEQRAEESARGDAQAKATGDCYRLKKRCSQADPVPGKEKWKNREWVEEPFPQSFNQEWDYKPEVTITFKCVCAPNDKDKGKGEPASEPEPAPAPVTAPEFPPTIAVDPFPFDLPGLSHRGFGGSPLAGRPGPRMGGSFGGSPAGGFGGLRPPLSSNSGPILGGGGMGGGWRDRFVWAGPEWEH